MLGIVLVLYSISASSPISKTRYCCHSIPPNHLIKAIHPAQAPESAIFRRRHSFRLPNTGSEYMNSRAKMRGLARNISRTKRPTFPPLSQPTLHLSHYHALFITAFTLSPLKTLFSPKNCTAEPCRQVSRSAPFFTVNAVLYQLPTPPTTTPSLHPSRLSDTQVCT